MNEILRAKYDELLTEFNRYIMTHPKFLAGIPDEALVVLLDPNDFEFNRYSLERVRSYRRNDDRPDRPVIYVDVGELAPVRSRLVKPRVLSHLPDTLAVAPS